MKSKMKGILGIGFAIVLIVGMMLFAIPAAAGPYANLAPQLPNMWAGFSPTVGFFGYYFFDPSISQVGPLAKAINGDIYAYVGGTQFTPWGLSMYGLPDQNPGSNDILKSTDGGHTWSVSSYMYYFVNSAFNATDPVKDMVCSGVSEDVVYLTDGNYVYKSINGGLSFFIVAEDSLETLLEGACGPTTVLTGGNYINCIDIGYNAAGDSYIFIGVNGTYQSSYNTNYPSVLYINEDGYPSTWADLQLYCFHNDVANGDLYGGYVPLSIGVAPNFDVTKKIYALVTTDYDYTGATDDGLPHTYVVSNVGVECSWAEVDELLWDCEAGHNFETYYASRFGFTSEYTTLGNVFIGVTAWDDTLYTHTPGGDVYVAYDTVVPEQDSLDLNVQGYTSACTGIWHANICSLDVSENDELMAGAYDSYQLQSPTRVYYSADGGWTWSPSLKDPTGSGLTHVLFGSAVAGTMGCDCAFSMSCGDLVGQYWNQISLISMSIEEVLDLSHAPGYVLDSQTMYVLTTETDGTCCYDAFSLTATSTVSTATIKVNGTAGSVVITVLNEATGTDIDITNSAPVAGQTSTITLYDVDDAVLVIATTDNTNITVTRTGGSIDYDEVYDCDGDMNGGIASSPGETFDMDEGCLTCEIRSLLRWDGTYWERVHSTRSYYALGQAWLNSPLYDWVEVSPDFNDTGCLYMANTSFQMIRSTDEGCSWRPLAYPCEPLPSMCAWIVVDEETVLASGTPYGDTAEWVYKTTRHGTRPWDKAKVINSMGQQIISDGVDFDLAPNSPTDLYVLLGDDEGRVFLSPDLGDSWAEIADLQDMFASFGAADTNTYVVFDPGFGTADDPGESMIYAAAGSLVGRCDLNLAMPALFQDWVYISDTGATCDPFDMRVASGIDAAGDTTLYVLDAGYPADLPGDYTVTGTIGIYYFIGIAPPYTMTTCDIDVDMTDPAVMWFEVTSGTFVDEEPLNILSYNLQCSEHPVFSINTINGELVVQGFTSGAIGILHISEILWGSCVECVLDQAVIVISGVLTIDVPTPATPAGPTGVWRTVNPMDQMPPVFPLPLVEWEFLELANTIVSGVPTTDHELRHPSSCGTDDLWLTEASNMLWALDRDTSLDATWFTQYVTWIWMWEDPLATQVTPVSPADGAVLATTTAATLEWEALDLATLYEIKVYAACPECLDPNEMDELVTSPYETDDTCITITGLLPGFKYHWKVRVACDSPFVSKWSTLRSFQTALDTVPYLCAPWCGQDDVNINTNFAWDAVLGATSYEVQIATDDAFSSIVSSGTTSANAWTPADPLDYSTVYYWRVKAISANSTSAWAVCIFTTADEPVEPAEPPPAVIIEETEITPTWIWVIIGIGGALTIAVVILIVTTRRVP